MQWRYSFFLQRYSPNRDPTQSHKHTSGSTPLDEWPARPRRPLPTQCTNIHAVSGIRTRDPSKRSDPGLRPRGHWDRQLLRYLLNFLYKNFFARLLRCKNIWGLRCEELPVRSKSRGVSGTPQSSWIRRVLTRPRSPIGNHRRLTLQILAATLSLARQPFQRSANIVSLIYVYVVCLTVSLIKQLPQHIPVDAVKDAVCRIKMKKAPWEFSTAGFRVRLHRVRSLAVNSIFWGFSHPPFHSFFDSREERHRSLPYPFRPDPPLTKHPATRLAVLVFQPHKATISVEHQINGTANQKSKHSVGLSTA